MLRYNYNGKSYDSEAAVRKAIWTAEHKAVADIAEAGVTTEAVSNERKLTLAEAKTAKLKELSEAFTAWRNDTATMVSSLGFTADADSRAMQDITGLWIKAQGDDSFTADFMDAENEAHTLTAEQILTLAAEVTQAGTDAYTQKWKLRAMIEACESVEAVELLGDISFDVPNYGEEASE